MAWKLPVKWMFLVWLILCCAFIMTEILEQLDGIMAACWLWLCLHEFIMHVCNMLAKSSWYAAVTVMTIWPLDISRLYLSGGHWSRIYVSLGETKHPLLSYVNERTGHSQQWIQTPARDRFRILQKRAHPRLLKFICTGLLVFVRRTRLLIRNLSVFS